MYRLVNKKHFVFNKQIIMKRSYLLTKNKRALESFKYLANLIKDMAAKLPKIKKKVNDFLLGEDGKISKESLLKAGAFVAGAAVASSLMAKSASADWGHSNTLTLTHSNDKLETTVTHSHHSSHSSY